MTLSAQCPARNANNRYLLEGPRAGVISQRTNCFELTPALRAGLRGPQFCSRFEFKKADPGIPQALSILARIDPHCPQRQSRIESNRYLLERSRGGVVENTLSQELVERLKFRLPGRLHTLARYTEFHVIALGKRTSG